MELVKNYLKDLSNSLNELNIIEIEKIAQVFLNARNNNKNIYVFGNGGSGSTASHMVCDILKGCSYGKEKRFKITCLNDNIPTLLAYSNDISYDVVFLEQLKNFINPGDVVIGISGSGNSINVINAIKYANLNNCITIGFTGFDGGLLKKEATYSLNALVNDMQITEDIHVIALHILYKLLSNK